MICFLRRDLSPALFLSFSFSVKMTSSSEQVERIDLGVNRGTPSSVLQTVFNLCINTWMCSPRAACEQFNCHPASCKRQILPCYHHVRAQPKSLHHLLQRLLCVDIVNTVMHGFEINHSKIILHFSSPLL